MSHCQTAKGQSQTLTENTGLGQRMMNELESRDDGGCWSARLPYTVSWVLSPVLETGKGTRENVLQALVRGIWGLGLWLSGGALFYQIWCPEVQLIAQLKRKLFGGYCGELLTV